MFDIASTLSLLYPFRSPLFFYLIFIVCMSFVLPLYLVTYLENTCGKHTTVSIKFSNAESFRSELLNFVVLSLAHCLQQVVGRDSVWRGQGQPKWPPGLVQEFHLQLLGILRVELESSELILKHQSGKKVHADKNGYSLRTTYIARQSITLAKSGPGYLSIHL